MNETSDDQNLVAVTNGSKCVQLPVSKVPDAKEDGFYVPADRGRTLVRHGNLVFEISSGEVDAAISSGGCDLLTIPRKPSVAAEQNETATEAQFNEPTADTKPQQDAGPSFPQAMNRAPEAMTSASDATPTIEVVDTMAPSIDLETLAELEELEGLNLTALEEQQELEEAAGWNRPLLRLRFWVRARQVALTQQLGGTGISILIHVALFLLLASFVLVNDKPEELVIRSSATSSDEVFDEIVVDPTPLDIVEPTEIVESDAPPEAEELPVEMAVEAPDLTGAISGDAVKPPAIAVPEPGVEGMEKPAKKPTFFGSKMAAINYVFVIDNSNSMTRGRFETAIHELVLTVNRLTPKQRFYVIFYSDTAYPMMHPNPAKQLVPATKQNKFALFQWLQTVQLCLRTQGREALKVAFNLDPDVIYVLGDGAFTDKAAEFFSQKPHERIVVHTRGMEVKPKDAISFKKLAVSHRGTYMDVGVAPGGAQMAKQFPRKRNNVRGPIWGITLPVKKP